jgi:hypothetical protein
MVIEADPGTVFAVLSSITVVFWTMLKLMFMQYEKRQETRFESLTSTLTEQSKELDEHMKKQDASMAEIRRVEGQGMAEARRIEAKINECQLDALQRFQTKNEATEQHKQILDAIRGLGDRIDRIHGTGTGASTQ